MRWIILALGIVMLSASVEARPRSGPSTLRKASICYGRGDMVCVIEALHNTPAPTDTAHGSEHWRLLAMAAARMDRGDIAREAFAAWIGLAPTAHKLDKSSVRPNVYRAYAAAWLKQHREQLDLKPRRLPQPAPLPAPVTVGDLPRWQPPPLSKRDKIDDTTMMLGVSMAPMQGINLVGWTGLCLAMERKLSAAWGVGLRTALYGRLHDKKTGDDWMGNGSMNIAVSWHPGGSNRFSVVALGGVAVMPNSVVAGGALRYDGLGLFKQWGQTVRPFAELVALHGAYATVPQPQIALSLGIAFGGEKG